jgi:zinc transporter, ZIP family
MPIWLQAGFWGLLGGSALVLGAAVAYFVSLPQRLVAAIMSIGAGVLISAVAFDLMDEAYRQGGFDSTSLGSLAGAAVYTAANIYISRRGGKHRKRSGSNPDERQQHSSEGSGVARQSG